jgi:hypothetical protein
MTENYPVYLWAPVFKILVLKKPSQGHASKFEIRNPMTSPS